jgi:hypothetical protein
LECGDLSPLCIRGDLSPRSSLESQPAIGCDRSQPAKAVTGHRTPKELSVINDRGDFPAFLTIFIRQTSLLAE